MQIWKRRQIYKRNACLALALQAYASSAQPVMCPRAACISYHDSSLNHILVLSSLLQKYPRAGKEERYWLSFCTIWLLSRWLPSLPVLCLEILVNVLSLWLFWIRMITTFFLSQTWSYCANPVTPEHTAKSCMDSSFQINAAVMQESNFWDVLWH